MLNIRFREKTNSWPGFVDLFSNLVIILIFLLIVFVFLWTTTSVFNKHSGAKKVAELQQVQKEQAEQIVQMTEDNKTAEELLLRARDALEEQEIEKTEMTNEFEQQKEDIAIAYEQKLAEMTLQQEQLAAEIKELNEQLKTATETYNELLARTETASAEKQAETEQLNAQIDELNKKLQDTRQTDQLNAQIAELNKKLQDAEELAKKQDIEYTAMSNRLNKALADKVAELNNLSQYQSDFYREIKNALGNRTTIKQEGDRFIVSSDILFPSGSYKISANGKNQLKLLANIIKDFETKIPSNIDWIIRVDGHTDNKAVVAGTPYKDNMQLSLLRATAVTNELVKNGVSKRRLVPSGFGELHPVVLGNDAESLQKNRRIELQLTNK